MSIQSTVIRFALPALLFTLVASVLNGQDYEISGVVKDTAQNPLESATVFMQSVKDSTTVDYTITDAKGTFSMSGKTNVERVNFYVSYIGFADFQKTLSIKDNPSIDLTDITMEGADNTLDEVTVENVGSPVKVKEDTLEFNASSFKTKEDAKMEDLLKKLPGVTVDNDGKIEVNGKEVSKIKMNGKDFFEDDPKIATKNLSKYIIDKLQVVDTKSKSDEFTGRESDSEDKTINIKTKEGKDRGLFARATVGGGTDHRYSLNGMGNYFNGDMRLSLLGSANNINSIGFSFDDIYDAMGRNAYAIGNRSGGSGITKSHTGGLDFTDTWNDIHDVEANYLYTRTSTETATKVQRENILPDRHYFNNSTSSSKDVSNNHRGSVSYEVEPDSMTRIALRPNINASNGHSRNNSETTSKTEDGTPINESTTENQNDVKSVNFSNRLGMTRKYGDKGGYYRLRFVNSNNNNKQSQQNFTNRDIFDDEGEVEDTKIQDQLIDQDKTEDEYTVDAVARIPFSEKWKMDLGYKFTHSRRNNERLVYEKDEDSDDYDVLNEDLSSTFKSKSYQQRPSAGIVYLSDNIRSGLSGGVESVKLKNDEKFTDTEFEDTYNNFYARFYMRYKLAQSKSFYFRYSTSQNIPSITQLQPVMNTTDPLHQRKGNPNLKPSLQHRFSLRYNNFDYDTHTGFFAHISGNYKDRQVASKTQTDEDLVRTTTYTNVDGLYDFNGGVSYNKEFKFEKGGTLKPKIQVNSSYKKDIGYSNEERYHSNTFSLGPRISAEYDLPDVINVQPSYRVSYNNTHYSLESQNNQDYANHDVGLELTSYWPDKFIFGNDVTYTHIGDTAPGFDNNYVLWNMSLGYKLLGDDGIFKVKVYDVLDENVSTSRDTGEDYIQDTQQMVLKRYMMFSFTYKFSEFGGKKGRKRGGYRRG